MRTSNRLLSGSSILGLSLLATATARPAEAACPPPPDLPCELQVPPGPAPDASPLADDALSTWPVHARDENVDDCQGPPITAIWNSFGEYQDHVPDYGHTGIDIRSNPAGGGDLVVAAADADIWAVATFNQDVCTHGYACRIYAKSFPSQDHIYYYAHLRLDETSPVDVSTRDAIIEALSNNVSADVVPGSRPLCEGRTLAQIGPFVHDRSHLHFSIFDVADNYNGVNPITVIDEPFVDDQAPLIEEFAFATCTEAANTSCQALDVTEGCNFGNDPLTGTVDLVVRTRDTLNEEPDGILAGGTESVGVHRAAYRVRRMPDGNENDGTLFGGTWYEFDRLPFECRGEDVSGCTDDPDHAADIDQDDFLDLVDYPFTGPELGITFFGYFFSVAGAFNSVSDFEPGDVEAHYNIPNRQWGLSGSWDTTQSPDGLYQVSVYVWDEAGNYDWEDHYVVVKNDPGPLPATADVMLRDHVEDTGASPSNPNGEKHWRSTDIKVVSAGSDVPPANDAWWDDWGPVDLNAGSDYEVYLRVRNLGCENATNVSGQVAFATPSMWNDEWEEIGPPGGVDLGMALGSGQAAVLGPFPWTPGAADAGHKCIKAVLDADGDPAQASLGEIAAGHVQSDNNIGQLNVKIFNEQPDMGFGFANPTTLTQPIALEVDASGFPLAESGSLVRLQVDYHPALAAAWAGVDGTTLVDDGTTLTLDFHQARVTMPPASVPAATYLDANATLILPAGIDIGIYDVDFFETVDGVVAGGMTVTAHNIVPQ
ncbi:MAG: hypothetical protein AAF799_24515 [Myxococcota bacterium]